MKLPTSKFRLAAAGCLLLLTICCAHFIGQPFGSSEFSKATRQTSSETPSALPPISSRQDQRGPAQPQPSSSSQPHATVSVAPLSRLGRIEGQPALSFVPQLNPQNLKGRTVQLKQAQMAYWSHLQEGSHILLPGFEEDSYEGTVSLRLEDNGWLRFGGRLKNSQGTFSLHVQSGAVAGTILLPSKGIALEIRTEPSGNVLLVERRISQLLCWPGLPQAAATPTTGTVVNPTSTSVPKINSRPGANGLIYLHFGGGTVVDPDWNGGLPIKAAPSGLSPDEIKEVIARVAEDYAPFDMAVSTISADYDKMPPGRRIRVIITPTNELQRGVGGLSLIGSWPSSGRIRSSTIPAWVFNSTPKLVAEAASHEVGHTLGLSHDGTLGSEYYSGNGTESSPTSWAPIMGNSYSRSLTQWSKGEYPNANNLEDDLAIISSARNGVGYGANTGASAGDAAPSGIPLPLNAGTFSTSGVLRHQENPDRYEFTTTGGALSVTAAPKTPKFANADLQLELYKHVPASGRYVLVSKANPPDLLESVLRASALAAGTYQIRVLPAGTNTTSTGIYATGYPPYGSLGPYEIKGTVDNAPAIPGILTPAAATGILGLALSLPITLSKGTTVTGSPASLPPGVIWDPKKTCLRGTPTQEGRYNVTFTLQANKTTFFRTLPLFIDFPGIALPVIDGALGAFTNSATAPWAGQLVPFTDNVPVKTLVSGRTANGGSSKICLQIPGNRIVSFSWKTSSEAGYDGLECRINGVLAKDLETGTPLKISGETSWVKHKTRVEVATTSSLEFSYTKDNTLSEGEDRGWIANVVIGVAPVLKKSPPSIQLTPTDNTFTLAALVDNASSLQWSKDGIPLVNVSAGSHSVTGATTATLTVQGLRGADSGAYTLAASNNFDTITSPKADVVVPLAPIITSQTAPTAPVKAGEVLLLGIDAEGAGPLTSSWKKNGRVIRKINGTLLNLGTATIAMAGTYSVSVSNSFGVSSSRNISVSVIPPP